MASLDRILQGSLIEGIGNVAGGTNLHQLTGNVFLAALGCNMQSSPAVRVRVINGGYSGSQQHLKHSARATSGSDVEGPQAVDGGLVARVQCGNLEQLQNNLLLVASTGHVESGHTLQVGDSEVASGLEQQLDCLGDSFPGCIVQRGVSVVVDRRCAGAGLEEKAKDIGVEVELLEGPVKGSTAVLVGHIHVHALLEDDLDDLGSAVHEGMVERSFEGVVLRLWIGAEPEQKANQARGALCTGQVEGGISSRCWLIDAATVEAEHFDFLELHGHSF